MTTQTVYVVTGGNRGIGKEIVRQLARARPEAVVVLTSRDFSVGEEVARGFHDQGMGNVVCLPCDVGVERDALTLADTAKARWGYVHVLVNNAGYASKGSALNQEIAQRTLGTNFFGTRFVTHAMLPLLQPGARVINISSGLGSLDSGYSPDKRRMLLDPALEEAKLCAMMEQFIEDVGSGELSKRGWPRSAYAVSKAGLNALTRVWARDWQDRGIMVQSVCPGWVRTDMGGPQASRGVEEGADTPVWLALTDMVLTSGRFFRDRAEIDF